MITYLYWGAVIALVIVTLVSGSSLGKTRPALVLTGVILLVGWAAYFFHFQQLFVKRYGGVMTIAVPQGEHHIAATWKDDNLWIENYDPVTNSCYFSEYSRGNMLQGKVTIKNCNPLMVRAQAQP